MRHTIRRNANDPGYTLIELAISILIAGLLVAPLFSLFHVYQEEQKLKNTTISITKATNAVGGFSSIYGRYPCPAPLNAVRGDTDYGYELRDSTTGACLSAPNAVIVATSNNTSLANRDIYIGALPFRQMNLQEDASYDGYGNRLLYAVTDMLANDATFNLANGGISIVDLNDESVISPEHSAHFVIVSHGQRNDGARSRQGTAVGTCPTASPETENCNFNETFRVGGRRNDFDDTIIYSTSIGITEWQIAVNNEQNIHLRRLDKAAIGANETTNLTTAQELEIRQAMVGDAVAIVETADPGTGKFISQQICDVNNANCFGPQVIGGQIADGEGMSCPSGEFLVGIANGVPICEDEIWFSCPAGNYIAGIDSSGRIICNTQPPPPCQDTTVSLRCGGTQTIAGTYSGGYSYGYSGQCYMIGAIDLNYVATLTTITEIQDYVNSLNAQIRTQQECGPDATTALIRESFRCNSGSWVTPADRAHRRRQDSSTKFPTNPVDTSSSYTVSTSGSAYNPSSPMSVDSGNSATNHNCWCREDYRVQLLTCPNNGVGNGVRIQKHSCPQTQPHTWTNIYTDNVTFCGCQEGTTTGSQACSAYFGVPSQGMTGNVIHTYQITCPNGPSGSPQVSSTPSSSNISACQCPARAPSIQTTSCPFATTNSFTYNGVNYTGVAQVSQNTWICPAGTPPTPATSAAHAGYWTGLQVVHTEPCVCNSNLTQQWTDPCPAGQQGPGITWRKTWDCSINDWGAPIQVSSNCSTCVWKKPAGTPDVYNDPVGNPVGGTCSCGANGLCRESAGGNMWNVWTGCTCSIN